MAKKVASYIKLQVPAGQANPSPPVGPALGQHGVNIMEFCKAFNAKTQELEKGLPTPVVITVYQDHSYTFITKTPPASTLLKMAAGDDVWDGILDTDPPGACTAMFPIYGTSRIVAGGPFKGSIFKCELKSEGKAIADGDYGVWAPTAAERAILHQIFPSGVCDFSKPDAGLPSDW